MAKKTKRKGVVDKNVKEEEKIYGKCFKDMTKAEILYLMTLKDRKLKRNVKFGQHALERMNERYIKERDVIYALKKGQILEYRKTKIDEVIVVRGCTMNRRREQVYVIYSVTSNMVITTYANKHWEVLSKGNNTDKYVSDFKINIPKKYKREIGFYYGVA